MGATQKPTDGIDGLLEEPPTDLEWEPNDSYEPITSPKGDGPEPPKDDEWPYTKSYIAIDGLSPDEISDEQAEDIRYHLLELLIHEMGLPVGNVRVVRDKQVVEWGPE